MYSHSKKKIYERAGHIKGEGAAYVAAGLLELLTQHTEACNRAVLLGPPTQLLEAACTGPPTTPRTIVFEKN